MESMEVFKKKKFIYYFHAIHADNYTSELIITALFTQHIYLNIFGKAISFRNIYFYQLIKIWFFISLLLLLKFPFCEQVKF